MCAVLPTVWAHSKSVRPFFVFEAQEGAWKMKTDIQIAQEAQMLPIGQVASMAGIDVNLLEYYGKV